MAVSLFTTLVSALRGTGNGNQNVCSVEKQDPRVVANVIGMFGRLQDPFQ